MLSSFWNPSTSNPRDGLILHPAYPTLWAEFCSGRVTKCKIFWENMNAYMFQSKMSIWFAISGKRAGNIQGCQYNFYLLWFNWPLCKHRIQLQKKERSFPFPWLSKQILGRRGGDRLTDLQATVRLVLKERNKFESTIELLFLNKAKQIWQEPTRKWKIISKTWPIVKLYHQDH